MRTWSMNRVLGRSLYFHLRVSLAGVFCTLKKTAIQTWTLDADVPLTAGGTYSLTARFCSICSAISFTYESRMTVSNIDQFAYLQFSRLDSCFVVFLASPVFLIDLVTFSSFMLLRWFSSIWLISSLVIVGLMWSSSYLISSSSYSLVQVDWKDVQDGR